MGWKEDLAFGKRMEIKTLDVLDPYISYEIMDGYFPDWDLRIKHKNGEVLTYEVKSDRMAKKTGNFLIDIQSLEKSKADYWVLNNVGDEEEIIETFILPIEILQVEYRSGGNIFKQFARSSGFLLPISRINELIDLTM